MGSASQLYSLSWGEFGSSLASAVQLLRGHGDLVDVTLAAEGRTFSAHKIVLSAASPFLLELLKSTPCQHPVVMLAGIGANELESILEFVYKGEISVEPSQLPSLLQAAHCLSIHGLTPPTIMTEKGEQIPVSAIPGCNDANAAREAMNSYLSPRKRKKKRKLSGGGGKWPRAGYSIESRSHDSEDNRSDYGHKDGDDDDAKERSNHHISSPLPQHQLVHPVHEHNPGGLISEQDSEQPHLHNLMPMQPYSPLHIPQFPGAMQNVAYSSGTSSVPAQTTSPSNTTSTTSTQSTAKIRGASDCPGTCPLCGATLRQARNLRRHLLSSCKYRFTANPNHQVVSNSMSVEVKPEIDIPGYPGDWKSRTQSDQPATCPLCGASIRQSRNLRRHLELLHFGSGSGKSGIRVKKDKSGKSFTPKTSHYSRTSLVFRDRDLQRAKSEATDYSSMSSLNLSTGPGSNSSSIHVPGSLMLTGSAGVANHHHHHPGPAHSHNTTPAHATPAVACPPPPPTMVPPNNGVYSSESASMLSCLLPTLPTLPTLSTPHDVFRHSEFLRANMGYPHDPTRQHYPSARHLPRTELT
ncbi:protein tramtrack, alpha isoform-like isoform X2 [Phymastichus coffea]|nr:protein tramtrack, alpha isoform-like isoform X2 [Phymastichus coffea]XP_058804312.1 protein tramtrack, alpha isoform-like isoform X2 [Phymastichus coffea]XP_058804313.1 protein tramtrack, alpha isoform-like isoform X2 [Phymastichus coffea]XP_058804315.1 protein tramtrack, alpha isoform-like isoform X2 [Phymastichus coffea]XP_058804316.1 protein tramtrack, alpha isoform-like isoform X2 [Phymastichus coffea]XP_058804317.1 protein tramtrack, alpha isoform-like isoform X2 [Phymastichus coffea]